MLLYVGISNCHRCVILIVVNRVNLTIRQSISFLVRRAWGTAQFSPELEFHLHWWRGYYHYSRYHASLRVTLAPPPFRARPNSFPDVIATEPLPWRLA